MVQVCPAGSRSRRLGASPVGRGVATSAAIAVALVCAQATQADIYSGVGGVFSDSAGEGSPGVVSFLITIEDVGSVDTFNGLSLLGLNHTFLVRNASPFPLRAKLLGGSSTGSPTIPFEPGETVQIPCSLNSRRLHTSFTKVYTLVVTEFDGKPIEPARSAPSSYGDESPAMHRAAYATARSLSDAANRIVQAAQQALAATARALATHAHRALAMDNGKPTQPRHPFQRGASAVDHAGRTILVCEEPVHDFGEIWAGDPPIREHTFKVTNVSPDTVHAKLIGYHSSSAREYRFEPRQTLDVRLTLRTARLRSFFAWTYELRVINAEPAEPAP